MRQRRHWVTLAKDVVKMRTFKGYPSNRQEELQLTEADVKIMQDRIRDIPVRYNHDNNTYLGKVTNTRINVNGSWDVELGLSVDTPEGEATVNAVEQGLIDGVSLSHELFSNKPKEVSVCVRGARPGTKFIRKAANSNLYTVEDDPAFVISASHEQANVVEDAEELQIFRVIQVVASAMVDTEMTPAAAAPVAAPAAAPAAQPDERKSPEAEAEIAAATIAAEGAASLPRTKEAQDLLRSKGNSIPTSADKEKLNQIVMDVEMEAETAREENAELKLEVQRLRAAAERAEKMHQHSQRMLGDTVSASKMNLLEHAVDTFQTPERAAEMKDILASADPVVFSAVADLMGNIAKATAGKPAGVVADIFATKKVAEYLENKKKKAKGNNKPDVPDTAQKFSDWAQKGAEDTATSLRPSTTVMASYDANYTVDASAACGEIDFYAGDPIERPPIPFLVSASAAAQNNGRPFRSAQEQKRAHDRAVKEENAKPAFEPGAGANWPWAGVLKTPEQVKLFMTDPQRTTSQVKTHFRLKELLGNGEALETWKMNVPMERMMRDQGVTPVYHSDEAYN